MRVSRIDPTLSAYEAVNIPNDLNQYPLAPLGYKSVVYKDGDTRGSWASRGVDNWYLGPLKDHYRCDLYFIPKTRAYQISGSTKLFPQHCQLLCLTPKQHFRALAEEMMEAKNMDDMSPVKRGIIKTLQNRMEQALQQLTRRELKRVSTQE